MARFCARKRKHQSAGLEMPDLTGFLLLGIFVSHSLFVTHRCRNIENIEYLMWMIGYGPKTNTAAPWGVVHNVLIYHSALSL